MATEEIIGFECVRPIESHAHLVMSWRNDPQTLAMSYHSEPKAWETFYPEFLREYFNFPDLPPLFALDNGRRVAFLRFRPVPHPLNELRRCCDISINVAPECRGEGLGQRIVSEIKEWVIQRGYDDLYAEVKKENAISQKMFLKAGFLQLEAGVKEVIDTGERFSIRRFLAPLSTKQTPSEEAVFVIAEAGSNWRMGTPSRDMAMLKTLIEIAAEAEADAIKFQIFRPETLYVPNAGPSQYLSKAGIEDDMQNVFADLIMPYDRIPDLAAYCQKCGVEFMATAFSKSDFAIVDPFVARHKIASYEISHVHLIEMAAKTGKPLILSTGAAIEEEMTWAVNTFRANGGGALTLLQCTASYPADAPSMNLRTIPWLKQRYQTRVGLSDHSRHPLCAPLAAAALGATVIEKHFTLDNRLPGPDHAFALMPAELKEMVHAIRRVEKMLGSYVKVVHESEQELRAYACRGIQALRDIHQGDIFHEDVNIAILRPGTQPRGVHSKYLKQIEGKPAKHEIPMGSGLQLRDW
jgi:sialic acid synthase SpsE/ribosomal protein S18 acetylase RimI-like enzyme